MIDRALSDLEKASVVKESDGETKVSKIVAAFSESVARGLKEAFPGSENTDRRRVTTASSFTISDIQIVAGRRKNVERVIGLVKNGSSEIVEDVTLVISFFGKDGKLIDVTDDFTRIEGIIRPGEASAFAVSRELGDWETSEDMLNGKRAAAVQARVGKFSMIDLANKPLHGAPAAAPSSSTEAEGRRP